MKVRIRFQLWYEDAQRLKRTSRKYIVDTKAIIFLGCFDSIIVYLTISATSIVLALSSPPSLTIRKLTQLMGRISNHPPRNGYLAASCIQQRYIDGHCNSLAFCLDGRCSLRKKKHYTWLSYRADPPPT